MADLPDHPDLPYKPPLAFVLAMTAGFGVHELAPMQARPAGWAPLGVTLVALATALLGWSLSEFRSAHTPLEPWKPTRAIVSSGPFAFSRNPVYVAFGLVQLGVGLWTDRLAVVVLVIPAWLATAWWIVPREERYLERKFGAVYRDYVSRVRRWL